VSEVIQLVQALVIVGAGRQGRELEYYLHDITDAPELLGFIDDDRPAGPFSDSFVLGNLDVVPELLRVYQAVAYITAAGDNAARRSLAARADTAGLLPWTLRHPASLIGSDCIIGAGTCLAPNTVATRAVELGTHCIVNVGVTISHDCIIGDYVNLNPGVTVCGDVEIGSSCYIGAGATIIDKVSIGADTVVGAGAVVVDDLPPGVLAVGVPARIVRELHPRPRLV
jgi:sugar O-acyltransferase (sialic acid O-acetyltransferase NeuD family)